MYIHYVLLDGVILQYSKTIPSHALVYYRIIDVAGIFNKHVLK